jgi:hypothetical protein
MTQLAISNVISISVAEPGVGIGEYNTSNLAIFSRETPGGGFGSDGYKIYLEPAEVGTDFGTGSDTYKMALAVFSQKPNILANRGYLVVIPFVDTADVVAVQHIAFSGVPASGNYKLQYGANNSGSIAYSADAAAVQTALRLLSGLGSVTVTGDTTAGFNVTFTGVTGAATLLSPNTNSLQTATPVDVVITATTTTAGTTASTETIAEAITRTTGLVQYFGITVAEITSEVNMDAAAAVVETLNKIAFWGSRDSTFVDSGGAFDDIAVAAQHQNRCLLYLADNDTDVLTFVASYAARGLSTNFSGSNTTLNMHLKTLIGVDADLNMTQTILNKCQDAGADAYPSIQGVAKVFASGANWFFDRIYNLRWFVGALEVAGFNYLAQSETKIPQTEGGISGLKGAYRKVCVQSVVNQYVAPGEWNSPTTFGNLADFLDNITQQGYYIYSAPVSQQSQAAREAREAPLIQIAIKEAGAVDSSTVIVNINA